MLPSKSRWLEYAFMVWVTVVYVLYFRQFTNLAREVFAGILSTLTE